MGKTTSRKPIVHMHMVARSPHQASGIEPHFVSEPVAKEPTQLALEAEDHSRLELGQSELVECLIDS